MNQLQPSLTSEKPKLEDAKSLSEVSVKADKVWTKQKGQASSERKGEEIPDSTIQESFQQVAKQPLVATVCQGLPSDSVHHRADSLKDKSSPLQSIVQQQIISTQLRPQQQQQEQPIFSRVQSEELIVGKDNTGVHSIAKCDGGTLQQPRSLLKDGKGQRLSHVRCTNIAIPNCSEPAPRETPSLCEKDKGIEISQNKETKIEQTPTIEPLDLKTLSVLNLSSPTQNIRPPSPKGERVLKPWQKKKKIKPKDQSSQGNLSTGLTVLGESVSTGPKDSMIAADIPTPKQTAASSRQIESEDRKAAELSQIANDKAGADGPANTMEPRIVQSVHVEEHIVQEEKQIVAGESEVMAASCSERERKQDTRRGVSKERDSGLLLTESDPPLPSENNSMLQQHSAPSNKQPEVSPTVGRIEPEYVAVQPLAQQDPPQGKQQPQAGEQTIQKPTSPPFNGEDSSITGNSVFGEEQIVQEAERQKRLEQLEAEIKRRKDIRQQLELSTPVAIRLAISLAAGAAAGVITYICKKDRLGSLVLGVASGVSSFLLSK